jgi:hypothetical protein
LSRWKSFPATQALGLTRRLGDAPEQLATATSTACPNGIPRGAQVDVALILTAVNNALNGCR